MWSSSGGGAILDCTCNICFSVRIGDYTYFSIPGRKLDKTLVSELGTVPMYDVHLQLATPF